MKVLYLHKTYKTYQKWRSPSNCSELIEGIYKAGVALCGSVELGNQRNPEPVTELWPDVAAEAISEGDTDPVLSVVLRLKT